MTIKDLKPGMRVTCNIDGTDITDAKIQIENEYFFICQNKEEGIDCDDKLGYLYSWKVSKERIEKLLLGESTFTVSNFKVVKGDARYFNTGDVITNGKDSYSGIDRYEILAVLARRGWKTTYVVSDFWNKGESKEEIFRSRHSTSDTVTAYELKDWKLVTYKKKTTKLTVSMDDVARKFGVDVKKLKFSK